MDPIRIAVLDLYEGEANEGMRCIRQLLEHFKNDHQLDLTYQVFDVRMKKEIAGLGLTPTFLPVAPAVRWTAKDRIGRKTTSN